MELTNKSQAAQHIASVLYLVANQKTLLLLSGGSSDDISVKALAQVPNNLLKNITVMLTDERYVAYDSADSNARLLKALGVEKYCESFIEILTHNNDEIGIVTDTFRSNLANQLASAKNVIAVLGVGTNNHTAGIMPNSVSSTTNEPIAMHYKYTDFERITIAPTFFKQINVALLYAEGVEKEKAVQTIEKDLNYIEYPSQLIKQCQNWQVVYNREKL